jgi:CxC4 like cysteine cluster associated with KDZ transposases
LSSDDPSLKQIPFNGGHDLPSLVSLGQFSRCNCGVTASDLLLLPNSKSEIIIYTSVTAIPTCIETKYCPICTNTKGHIGPDMGEYGVFNWNNRMGFSHELFNSFTSQFTTSETPMYAYHQTVLNTYSSEDSPVPLCGLRTFVLAYFAFIRLQRIGSPMECLQCGPNPAIVIADGISVSLPKQRAGNLRPPTRSDRSKGHIQLPKSLPKATCFLGAHKILIKIRKALDSDGDEATDMMKAVLEEQVLTHEVPSMVLLHWLFVTNCYRQLNTVTDVQLSVTVG